MIATADHIFVDTQVGTLIGQQPMRSSRVVLRVIGQYVLLTPISALPRTQHGRLNRHTPLLTTAHIIFPVHWNGVKGLGWHSPSAVAQAPLDHIRA